MSLFVCQVTSSLMPKTFGGPHRSLDNVRLQGVPQSSLFLYVYLSAFLYKRCVTPIVNCSNFLHTPFTAHLEEKMFFLPRTSFSPYILVLLELPLSESPVSFVLESLEPNTQYTLNGCVSNTWIHDNANKTASHSRPWSQWCICPLYIKHIEVYINVTAKI